MSCLLIGLVGFVLQGGHVASTVGGPAQSLGGPGFVAAHQKISNEQGLLADTLDYGDGFGQVVARLGDLDGDGICDVAATAPGDRDGGSYGLAARGAVWILFLDAQGGLKAHQKIGVVQGGFDGALDPGDSFGSALAGLGDLDGDGVEDLAVGARGDDDGASNLGAIWILFLRADGTVKAHQKISASAGGFGGELGYGDGLGALAAVGDLDGDGHTELAVGNASDEDGGSQRGALWILFLEADGSVGAEQKISSTAGGFSGDLDDQDFFGAELAALGDLDGDGVEDLAAIAIGDDDGGVNGDPDPLGGTAAIWVLFLQSDGTVRSHQKISSTQGGFDGGFLFLHSAVGLQDVDGDGVGELALGYAQDNDGGNFRGSVRVLFLAPAGTVVNHRKISDTQGSFTGVLDDYDYFGYGVAWLGDLDGDGRGTLSVGAIGDDDGGPLDRGALWQIELDSSAFATGHTKVSESLAGLAGTLDDDDQFGFAATALGDLDGDGVGDLAVGAILDDDGGENRGAVYILFLGPDGTVRTHQKVSSTQGGFTGTPQNHTSFGVFLASLGDVDGDGTRDLAVGSSANADGQTNVGSAWVLFLEPDGTVRAHQQIGRNRGGFTGTLLEGAGFSVVAGLGDLDDDGTPDLAVGSPGIHDGGLGTGAVWILFLNADGTVRAQQKISATSGDFTGALDDYDGFGAAVAPLGDFDADGVEDLVVGSNGAGHWILLLDPDGTVKSEQALGSPDFRPGVSSLGDLDGDGVVDLAFSTDPVGGQRVWIAFLEPNGTIRARQEISATQGGFAGALLPGEGFGYSAVAGVGDLDGDGVGDLAVGSRYDYDGGFNHGAVWLLSLEGTVVLDFEHGDDLAETPLVNGQDPAAAFDRTVTLGASGEALGPAIFDTTPGGPNDPGADPDLLVGLGNALILQAAQSPAQTIPGIYDVPDSAEEGGVVSLAFDAPVAPLSLDLVALDGRAGAVARITLFDADGGWRTYSIPPGWTGDRILDGPPGWRTLDLVTLDPQPGFTGGTLVPGPKLRPRSNQLAATAIETPGFHRHQVVRLEARLAQSGALDNLRWDPRP